MPKATQNVKLLQAKSIQFINPTQLSESNSQIHQFSLV